MNADALIEQTLRQGPPDEPRYDGWAVAFDTTERAITPVRPLRLELPTRRLTWAVLIVALLAVALAAALIGARYRPAISNGRLAYVVMGGGMQPTTDVVGLAPGGSLTNLTASAELSEASPQWSADGNWLAFTRHARGEVAGQLYVVPAVGGNERLVAETGCLDFAWLHDDRLICWSGDAVWVYDLNGGMPHGLRIQDTGQAALEWTFDDVSADATKVLLRKRVFEAPPGSELRIQEPGGLYVLDLTTAVLRQIVTEVYPRAGRAQFSPDGTMILAARAEGDPETSNSVWLMAVDGSWRRELVPATHGVALGAPIWTPDGTRVLYESGSTLTGRPDGIWMVNLDGSGQRSLT